MKKFWSIFNLLEGSVMVIGMAVMVFFNFFNVVCRYLLPQSPFSYTEELIVIVFLWVTMFGISYGFRKGAHTMLDVFTNMFPYHLQLVTIVFSTLCSLLLQLLMAKVGWDMVENQIAHGQVTAGMRLPMAISSAAIPIGAVITAISVLKTGYDELDGAIHQRVQGLSEKKEGS